MPDDPVKALLDKFHPEAKAEGGDAVTSLLDRFHPVATAPAAPRREAVPLTYADGSAVEDTTPKPTLDDRIGTERTEASGPVDYDEFRRDERDPMYAPERAKAAEDKRLAERGFFDRSIDRSLDTAQSILLAIGGRGDENATGIGETIGTLMSGQLPNETSKKRTREKVAEAGKPWSEAIGYLERKDPGNVGIRPAETAGRLAVDLGTMALPGAAGVHGAKGFALGSVLSDPTHPAEAAVSGALAYAGMKGGAALLSKPIAAVAERAVSKMAPETAKFLTRALTGVAEGAGMAAAPHVTEDGLHSALLGAIQGNPDDKISAATNILLVAAFRAYGREIPTPVAEAYLRGNFARVPATIRPLMDSIAGPIIRAGEETREVLLRADRPRRTEVEIDRVREAESAKQRPSVEPPDQDAAALRMALGEPEYIRQSVGLDAARRREAFQQEGARDRRLQDSMKETVQRLVNNGFGQSDTSIPLTRLIRERFKVSDERAKTVIDDLRREGIIEADLARRELGEGYVRPEVMRSDVYTPEDAAVASQKAAERLALARRGLAVRGEPYEPPTDVAAPSAGSGVRHKRADIGAVDVGPVVEAAGAAAKGVARSVADTFGSFTGRIRAKGTETAVEMADKSEKIVDRAKELQGTGEQGLGAERDTVMKLSGELPTTELGKASKSLSENRPVPGTDYAFSRYEEAVRGRQFDGSPVQLTPEEAKIVEATRGMIDKGGRMSEKAGVEVFNPETEQYEPFKNIPGGRVFPHVMSPEMMDSMTKGPSDPLFRKIVDAYAKANDLSRDLVEKDFLSRHEAAVSGIPTPGEGPTQVEFKRYYKKIPSAINMGGEWINLFETHPYEYAKRFTSARAHRLAFIEEFGQDIQKPKPVSGGDTDIVMGGGNPITEPDKPTIASRFKQAQSEGWGEDFAGLVRGLHGHAVRKPILEQGGVAAKAARYGQEALKVVKALNLTTSGATNTAEFTGNMSTTFGRPEAWKAMLDMTAQTPGWKADRAAVEQIGAVTRDVLNASFDNTHPVRSGIRVFGEVLRRLTGHGPINESQEYATAVLALRAARRFQAGKGRPIDVDRVEAIGYPREVAKRLVDGKATKAEYDAFVRKAPGQLVGANLSNVEKSSIEANRVVRGATAFTHYAWMAARNAAGHGIQFLRGINEAATSKSLSPSERWSQAYNASRNLAGFVANKAIQGTLGSFILAFLTEGRDGAKIKWNELKDRPFNFALNSFLYSTFGGPVFGTMARAAGGESLRNVDNAIYPWFALKEIVGVLKPSWGPDRYKGKDVLERMGEWWKRNAPIHRSIETFFAAVGLGSERAKDIDTARRAYYRWLYDTPRKGAGSFTPPDTEEANEYRQNIRAAAEAVERGATPEVVNAYVMKALGVEGKDESKVAESIERRMLLSRKDVKDRLGELKARIGEDAYAMLELHDRLIERLAESIRPQKIPTRQRGRR